MRRFYLIGAILGFIVPYLFFSQFLIEYGLDLGKFLEQMFGSPIAAFFTVDVIITSIVLWGFIFS